LWRFFFRPLTIPQEMLLSAVWKKRSPLPAKPLAGAISARATTAQNELRTSRLTARTLDDRFQESATKLAAQTAPFVDLLLCLRPQDIGVDLSRRYQNVGDAEVAEGELPVFWACGLTPQLAVRNAKPPLCITHAPSSMLITDLRNASLAVL